MSLHQRKLILLDPDDNLLHIAQPKIFLNELNESFFIRDMGSNNLFTGGGIPLLTFIGEFVKQ